MPYFPLFINLENKNVLIVGGGAVAKGKAEKLLPFKPHITVIADSICSGIKILSENEDIELCERAFSENDLDTCMLCIAATSDREFNKYINALCTQKGIPVNVVDDPSLCSFFFPALITDGSLSIGISTAGNSPAAASELKKFINASLPENIGDIIEYIGTVRAELVKTEPEIEKRSELLRRIYGACIVKGSGLSETELFEIMNGVAF